MSGSWVTELSAPRDIKTLSSCSDLTNKRSKHHKKSLNKHRGQNVPHQQRKQLFHQIASSKRGFSFF
jgi:hypothetical protein